MKKQNIIIWQENLFASEMQIFISRSVSIFVKWKQVKTKKYDVTNTSGIVQVPCNILLMPTGYTNFAFKSNWQIYLKVKQVLTVILIALL